MGRTQAIDLWRKEAKLAKESKTQLEINLEKIKSETGITVEVVQEPKSPTTDDENGSQKVR